MEVIRSIGLIRVEVSTHHMFPYKHLVLPFAVGYGQARHVASDISFDEAGGRLSIAIIVVVVIQPPGLLAPHREARGRRLLYTQSYGLEGMRASVLADA